jgi:hypothetical protein
LSKKDVKKLNKMLGLEPRPPTKAQMIEELQAACDDMDLELLTACAKDWRGALLRKLSIKELRQTYKEECCAIDIMNGGEGDDA